ncbi:MAG: hypothetical protein AAB403_14545 [Planctomycetota bacterium]
MTLSACATGVYRALMVTGEKLGSNSACSGDAVIFDVEETSGRDKYEIYRDDLGREHSHAPK